MSHYCSDCRGFAGGPCDFPAYCSGCDAVASDPDLENWEDGQCPTCLEGNDD